MMQEGEAAQERGTKKRMIKRLEKIVRDNRRYIWISIALLLIGVLFGYANAESIQQQVLGVLEKIRRIAEGIKTANNPLFYTFWVIFKNNVLAVFGMIGLGIFFFGLYPALGIVNNGILLGFLMKMYEKGGVSPLKMLAAGILPHGIIELAAVVFAAAIGIKLGVMTYDACISLFVTEKRVAVRSKFSDLLRDLPLIVGTVVVMLFVAAIIESTVTPLLVESFVGKEIDIMKQIGK
jgi:stage II sporulation protein M